ncbi:MAG TPA: VOC family protein [Vicinamibacterales bacterium]|jgi:catechol 2,3-dioxygenase-like lactoylglutathione lyase family enzyme
MKFSDVTPNLIVTDVSRSTAFYRDVLGFSTVTTVPEAPPWAFAWMQRDGVSVFLNSQESVRAEHAELGGRPIGGGNTIFIVLAADTIAEGVDAMYAAVSGRARVVMTPKNQFYGMREFGIEDPDGYVIFFAQQLAPETSSNS